MLTLALPSRAARRLGQLTIITAMFAGIAASARAGDETSTSGAQAPTRTLGVVLYPRFELLDVYGPVEMFGAVGNRVKIVMVGYQAGPIASAQGPKVVADYAFD